MRQRSRRSCLTVPGSNPRMIAKARGIDADEIILDLEDSVAPRAKADARTAVAAALLEGGWEGRTRAVRINAWDTRWTYRDLVEVVETAGAELDCLVLPKVRDASHVTAVDLLLAQVERSCDLPVGAIGLEAQIEDAEGVTEVHRIARASPRLESLVFGPGDFMASIGMSSLVVGEPPPAYTADAYHHVHMTILLAARASGLQAIDGPYGRIADLDGLRRSSESSDALGLDGRWVVHPSQVAICNEVYSPTPEAYARAEAILAAYERATSAGGGHTGAVVLDDEMIDEASRKMALSVAAKGRAAGLGNLVLGDAAPTIWRTTP